MVKRILQMVYKMNMGGVENFLMNIYRNINREEYQFDFIVQCEEPNYFDEEIKNLGGNIYRIPRFEKHPIKHIRELKKIMRANDYQAFHRHTANSVVFIDLLVAKLCGMKIRISHSHSSTHKNKFLNLFCRPLLNHFSTVKLACGNTAGKWLYGNKKFNVLNNAIDCEKYIFNDNIRKQYRDELKLEDSIAIGHVGRFGDEKNHKFIIKFFYELCKKNSNYKLVLCGDGVTRNEIESMCENLGILDKVLFLGIRNDIARILQAMDIFVFPSLYEGLPVTLVEAQMTNVPILMSDKIPKEAIYNENVKVLGISENDVKIWSTNIKNCKIDVESRKNVNDKIMDDYDVSNVVKQLCNIYEGDNV